MSRQPSEAPPSPAPKAQPLPPLNFGNIGRLDDIRRRQATTQSYDNSFEELLRAEEEDSKFLMSVIDSLTQQLAQARAEGAVLRDYLRAIVEARHKPELPSRVSAAAVLFAGGVAPQATAFLSQLSQAQADVDRAKIALDEARTAHGTTLALLSQATARAERAAAAPGFVLVETALPPMDQMVEVRISDTDVAIEDQPTIAYRRIDEWWAGVPGNWIGLTDKGWRVTKWRPIREALRPGEPRQEKQD